MPTPLLRVLSEDFQVGTIKKSKRFEELDNLQKADLLQGWLYDIDKLYDEAVENLLSKGL